MATERLKLTRCINHDCQKRFEVYGSYSKLPEIQRSVHCPYCHFPNETAWPSDAAIASREMGSEQQAGGKSTKLLHMLSRNSIAEPVE